MYTNFFSGVLYSGGKILLLFSNVYHNSFLVVLESISITYQSRTVIVGCSSSNTVEVSNRIEFKSTVHSHKA